MAREHLTDRELSLMRRTAGSGRVPEETIAEDQALVALLKKKIMTARGLTKEGWDALKEIDDDWWND
jgi:hypothetical protein